MQGRKFCFLNKSLNGMVHWTGIYIFRICTHKNQHQLPFVIPDVSVRLDMYWIRQGRSAYCQQSVHVIMEEEVMERVRPYRAIATHGTFLLIIKDFKFEEEPFVV